MHDIVKVIDAIRQVSELPKEVGDCLKRIAFKAAYTAPELQQSCWSEARIILANALGDPAVDEWKQVVQGLFSGSLPCDPRPTTKD